MGTVDEFVGAVARATAKQSHEEFAAFIGNRRRWHAFVTGTYDPKKVLKTHSFDDGRPVKVGLQKLRRDVPRFARDVGAAMGGVELFAGFEPHESGSLHFHALAHFSEGLKFGAIVALHDAWFPHHGYIDVDTNIASPEAVAGYVAKFARVAAYAMKQQGDFWWSPSLATKV